MGMLELANTPLNGNVGMRATTEDPIWAFVARQGRDMAKLILSFACGVMVGKGDLSKAKLLEVGLELKALSMENNGENMRHWRAIVDDGGEAIEGGIREALVGFGEEGEGEVYDYDSKYSEKYVVYGRLVDDVVVPV